MPDLDFELRLQLLRVQPLLSLSQADGMIRAVVTSCLEVHADQAACETSPTDFFTLVHRCGAALIVVCRTASVEFFTLAADNSLVHQTEPLAMCDVQEFLALVRSRFSLPAAGLVVPASEAMLWMKAH